MEDRHAAPWPMRQIGKYQVQEQIGIGGFGEVFKGFDPFIKRYVAIKTCSSRSEEIRTRFFQEAEISGNLNHKNITTIHDFGVEGDLPYLVQEYLSGEDLDEKVKRRDVLPFVEKLYYLIQIVRGLGHAHRRGVIHRDIKPANVRILEDGTAKIMDFGIAKLAQAESGLTQTGMTLGTAAYLSPEQIRGESVDPRTDIFSFGVMAYELLTYERPFKGEQISAVLYQLLHHEPKPIAEIWPEAPAELAAIIERCLAKQPAGRFQDAASLLRALEGLQWSGPETESGGAAIAPRAQAGGGPTAAKPEPGPPVASGAPAPSRATGGGSGVGEAKVDSSEMPGLEDVEISTSMVRAPELDDETTRVPTVSSAAQSSSGTLTTLFAILAFAAAAGLGGWWFGARPAGGDAPEKPPAQEAASGADVSDEPIDVQPTAPSPAEAAGASPGSETPAAQLDEGTLVAVKPDWTERMTVRLDRGKARALDKDRAFKRPPGTYTLTFRFAQDAYEFEQAARVKLGEAAVRRVRPPFPEPAAITVQQAITTPRGQVFIDGKPYGNSTLRSALLSPGERQVEIRPLGEGEPLSTSLTLAPGALVVLTFDLETGKMTQTQKELVLR
ncbi:MAG: protein kinase [Acidobacteriota bacterium]